MAMTKNNQVEEWLNDEDNLLLLESWARDGYTVADIATRVGVHVSTFRGWMADYPEIKKAVNTGRELVDYKVENALLKAALGFKTREVKVVATMKGGRIVEERKEVIDKEFAPNVSAITAWLYNRQPKKWKNMNSKVNMFDDLDEDTSIHITVERATPANMDTEDSDQEDQDNINTGVSIRKATKEEQQAAKEAKAKSKASEDNMPDEDWEQWLKDDDSEVKTSTANKRSKSTKQKSTRTVQSKDSAKGSAHADAIQHTTNDDVDYWPDDWQDE